MGKEKTRKQMISANWGKGKRFSFRKKFNWFSNVLEVACNSFRIFFLGGGGVGDLGHFIMAVIMIQSS